MACHKSCTGRPGAWLLYLASLTVAAIMVAAAPRITTLGELSVGSLAFFNKMEGWGTGQEESLWRTVDGGRSWKQVKISVEGIHGPLEIVGTHFQSALEAWIMLAPAGDKLDMLLSMPVLAVTRDGGVTWKRERLPPVHFFIETISSGRPKGAVWIGGDAWREGNWRDEDMDCPQRIKGSFLTPVLFLRQSPGSSWEERRLPAQNGCPVSLIRFSNDLQGVVVAGKEIMFSVDGGHHWESSDVRSADGAPIKIDHLKIDNPVSLQFRGRDGWLGTEDGDVFNSVDGGHHWIRVIEHGTIWSKAVGFGSWGEVHFTSAEIGFTLGGDGELFETHDRGKTWSKVPTPERMTYLDCSDDYCWVRSNARLYRIE